MAYATLADDIKELHHPKTWVGKYVWSQDHKVIAIQYSMHRDRRSAWWRWCCRC